MLDVEPQPFPQSKYQLIAELGQGGMADVFLAILRGMKDFRKLAVIKRLRANLAEDPEFLAMFLQEARLAARLSHPNVVQTFEVGHDGRHHFMALEYLDGQSYSALMARAKRENLDLALQIKILMDVLEGLHYAHNLRDFDGKPLDLVHRDVSPQNVFISYDGQVKLLDFGIAKALDSAVETKTGMIKGKLAYMSPEQALSGSLDRRSDLYSVGVMLWEVVARRRRWKGLSNVELMKNIALSQELVLPRMEHLPSLLKTTLMRSLAYRPNDRYADALEFQGELEKVLAEMQVRVTTRELGKQLSDLFAEDRKRLDAIIEGEIKKLDERQVETIRPGRPDSLVHLDRPPTTGSSSILVARGYSVSNSPEQALEGERSETRSASALVRAEVKRRQRLMTVITPIMLLVLATGFVGIYLYGRHQSELRPAAATATGGSPASKVDEIEIKITATPSSAALFLNERRLGPSPYVGTLPKGMGTAEVRAEAAGFETESRTVTLFANTNLEFVLKPSVEESPNKGPSGARQGGYASKAPIGRSSKAKSAPTEAETSPPPVAPPVATSAPVAKPPARPLDSASPWK